MKKFLISLTAFFLLSACSEEPLDEYSVLDSLRILDIQVNTPEVNQLDTPVNFTVTPIVSDVGGSSQLTVKMNICLDPGIDYGKDAVCDGSLVIDATEAAPGTERTGALSARALSYTMLTAVFSQFSESIQYNGVPVIITLELSNGTQTVKSFKRVLFSTKSSLNLNPTLNQFLVNGQAWSALPTNKVELTAQTSSAESYTYKTSDGDILNTTEELQVTWFVTGQELTRSRTLEGESTEWTPGVSPGILIGIVRDGRGGSSMLLQSF